MTDHAVCDWIEVAAEISKTIRQRQADGTLDEPIYSQERDDDGEPVGERVYVGTVGEELSRDYADALHCIRELLWPE